MSAHIQDMTDTSSRKRQPRGTTTGGQFATEAKGESSISLTPAVQSVGLPIFTNSYGLPEMEPHTGKGKYDRVDFDPASEEGFEYLVENRYKHIPKHLRDIEANKASVRQELEDVCAQYGVPFAYVQSIKVQEAFNRNNPSRPREYAFTNSDNAHDIAQAWKTGMPHNWVSEAQFVGDGSFDDNAVNRWANGANLETLSRLSDLGVPVAAHHIRKWKEVPDEVTRDWFAARAQDPELDAWVDSYLPDVGLERILDHDQNSQDGLTIKTAQRMLSLGIQDPGVAYRSFDIRGQYTPLTDCRVKPDGTIRGAAAVEEVAAFISHTGAGSDQARTAMRMGLSADQVARYKGTDLSDSDMYEMLIYPQMQDMPADVVVKSRTASNKANKSPESLMGIYAKWDKSRR